MATQTIQLFTTTNKPISMTFDPNEPAWQFSKRLGEQLSSLIDNGNSNTTVIIYNKSKMINTLENRLEPMGKLMPDLTKKAYLVSQKGLDGLSYFYTGNSSPTY